MAQELEQILTRALDDAKCVLLSLKACSLPDLPTKEILTKEITRIDSIRDSILVPAKTMFNYTKNLVWPSSLHELEKTINETYNLHKKWLKVLENNSNGKQLEQVKKELELYLQNGDKDKTLKTLLSLVGLQSNNDNKNFVIKCVAAATKNVNLDDFNGVIDGIDLNVQPSFSHVVLAGQYNTSENGLYLFYRQDCSLSRYSFQDHHIKVSITQGKENKGTEWIVHYTTTTTTTPYSFIDYLGRDNDETSEEINWDAYLC